MVDPVLGFRACLLVASLFPGLLDEASARPSETLDSPAFVALTDSVGAHHTAFISSQDWSMAFDGLGFEVRPERGDWTWGLELNRWGRTNRREECLSTGTAKVAGTRLTVQRGERLDEWFVNDGRGLEHGYTWHGPAHGSLIASGEWIFDFELRGDLSARLNVDGRGLRFVDEAGLVRVNYDGLLVFDANDRELAAHFEMEGDQLRLRIDASEAFFPITIDPVAQAAYFKASNTEALDFFGGSMAMSGQRLVVGASGEDSGATGVDGNQADNSMTGAGAVYVFQRVGGTWAQEAYIKPSTTDEYDSFGSRVAIDGNTLIVGAPGESSAASGVDGDQSDNSLPTSGAAFVFEFQGGNWVQTGYLKAFLPSIGDEFGSAVAVAGNRVFVGARQEDGASQGVGGSQNSDDAEDSGAVYVFRDTGNAWVFETYIKSSNSDPGDYFGRSIAAWGDRLAIGAPFEASASPGINSDQSDNSSETAGAAYLFQRVGNSWTQTDYLKSPAPAVGQEFGRSIAMHAERLVVGSRDAGAFVFERERGPWQLEDSLFPNVFDAVDWFGFSVAIAPGFIGVGAPLEDGSSSGVDGDAFDNESHSAGAAYLFARSGAGWSQAAYLKASNSTNDILFGGRLAMSELGLVVSTTAESSASTGVNGDQSDTSAPYSGAVYLFETATDDQVAYCFGDSTGGACPCFNFGSVGAGCQHSDGSGALLSGTGFACTSNDSFALNVAQSKAGTPGLVFQGSADLGLGNALGDGLLCVTPARRWFPQSADAGGAVTYGPGIFSKDPAVVPGNTLHYQWWFRDLSGACGTGFNFSNGLSVTWQ